MKSVLVILSLLLAGSAQALTLNCHGVRQTKGSAVLVLNKSTDTLKIQAHYQVNEETNKWTSVQCSTRTSQESNYGGTVSLYYPTYKASACKFQYVRTHDNFAEREEGLVALINDAGGDNYHWSGYLYQYFYCKK